jgi:hypothetical protein
MFANIILYQSNRKFEEMRKENKELQIISASFLYNIILMILRSEECQENFTEGKDGVYSKLTHYRL